MKKKKGKDPAFLMYSGDFLVGTMTMTNEQVGKYIRLLCLHHQKGFLTETDLKQYLADTDLVLFEKFFRADDGNYYNNKMLDVINERKEYTANRLKNLQKKKHKNNDMSSHMDDDVNNHTGDEDEDESQDINQDVNSDKNENTIEDKSIEATEIDRDSKEILKRFDNMFSDI